MSWQADIGKLHSRAKEMGVELTDFESEVEDEDGWYTEDNILTLVESILDELSDFQDSLIIQE